MNIALSNKTTAYSTIIAKISKRVSNTSFEVRDAQNKLYTVESDGTYSVGQTVRIQNNVIIAKTIADKNIKHFVV